MTQMSRRAAGAADVVPELSAAAACLRDRDEVRDATAGQMPWCADSKVDDNGRLQLQLA
jgi:hypothetical protein